MEEFFAIAAVCFSVLGPLMGFFAYSEAIEIEAITAMVQRGSDPVAAMCAIKPKENASLCASYVAKK